MKIELVIDGLDESEIIELDDDVYEALVQEAHEKGIAIDALIESVLREMVEKLTNEFDNV